MKIIDKKTLADSQGIKITKIVVENPTIAPKALPGQFVLLMVSEMGERVPLTVVESQADRGTLTLIFQEVGFSTKLLGQKKIGESLYSLAGPLGHATDIRRYGKVIMVGGGVGIAEILPVARAFKAAGNAVISIIGSRTKDLMILENEMRDCSDQLFITTDDGTLGEKGFVSSVLNRILSGDRDYQLVYCVGPVPMMRVVSEVTRPFGVKTIVCLNAIMMDGTGMCGGCRLVEDGKVKFCCVDGPEFDGHRVDYAELIQRQKRFLDEEKLALQQWEAQQAGQGHV